MDNVVSRADIIDRHVHTLCRDYSSGPAQFMRVRHVAVSADVEVLRAVARDVTNVVAPHASLLHDAWQDGLDLIATIAGVKPVCLVDRAAAYANGLAAIGRANGLPMIEAPLVRPWVPVGSYPPWFAAATRAMGRGCYIGTIPDQLEAKLVAGERFTASEEATLLGYPLCCVVHHHAQATTRERLWFERLSRFAERASQPLERLVRAGFDPPLDSSEERRAWGATLDIDPEPLTSINRCPACRAAGVASAASRSGATLAALAQTCQYSGFAG